ncbi:hypothetical protein PPERSA_03007 [Pseudocohnilembus persalinus]|uniref:MORN motif n=1 Tax=Pseudocohnilembus persalinus TaxID=266149 RepID=A0A0V0QF31_PSEPJ|nr:hypothetical protein PPERSA_03007 [Pseudocohnilembus persalinus]|eukprot:KRX00747.1 hypothetical protein PPERSA_03007 [Pseudocohnilembus persalinus]
MNQNQLKIQNLNQPYQQQNNIAYYQTPTNRQNIHQPLQNYQNQYQNQLCYQQKIDQNINDKYQQALTQLNNGGQFQNKYLTNNSQRSVSPISSKLGNEFIQNQSRIKQHENKGIPLSNDQNLILNKFQNVENKNNNNKNSNSQNNVFQQTQQYSQQENMQYQGQQKENIKPNSYYITPQSNRQQNASYITPLNNQQYNNLENQQQYQQKQILEKKNRAITCNPNLQIQTDKNFSNESVNRNLQNNNFNVQTTKNKNNYQNFNQLQGFSVRKQVGISLSPWNEKNDKQKLQQTQQQIKCYNNKFNDRNLTPIQNQSRFNTSPNQKLQNSNSVNKFANYKENLQNQQQYQVVDKQKIFQNQSPNQQFNNNYIQLLHYQRQNQQQYQSHQQNNFQKQFQNQYKELQNNKKDQFQKNEQDQKKDFNQISYFETEPSQKFYNNKGQNQLQQKTISNQNIQQQHIISPLYDEKNNKKAETSQQKTRSTTQNNGIEGKIDTEFQEFSSDSEGEKLLNKNKIYEMKQINNQKNTPLLEKYKKLQSDQQKNNAQQENKQKLNKQQNQSVYDKKNNYSVNLNNKANKLSLQSLQNFNYGLDQQNFTKPQSPFQRNFQKNKSKILDQIVTNQSKSFAGEISKNHKSINQNNNKNNDQIIGLRNKENSFLSQNLKTNSSLQSFVDQERENQNGSLMNNIKSNQQIQQEIQNKKKNYSSFHDLSKNQKQQCQKQYLQQNQIICQQYLQQNVDKILENQNIVLTTNESEKLQNQSEKHEIQNQQNHSIKPDILSQNFNNNININENNKNNNDKNIDNNNKRAKNHRKQESFQNPNIRWQTLEDENESNNEGNCGGQSPMFQNRLQLKLKQQSSQLGNKENFASKLDEFNDKDKNLNQNEEENEKCVESPFEKKSFFQQEYQIQLSKEGQQFIIDDRLPTGNFNTLEQMGPQQRSSIINIQQQFEKMDNDINIEDQSLLKDVQFNQQNNFNIQDQSYNQQDHTDQNNSKKIPIYQNKYYRTNSYKLLSRPKEQNEKQNDNKIQNNQIMTQQQKQDEKIYQKQQGDIIFDTFSQKIKKIAQKINLNQEIEDQKQNKIQSSLEDLVIKECFSQKNDTERSDINSNRSQALLRYQTHQQDQQDFNKNSGKITDNNQHDVVNFDQFNAYFQNNRQQNIEKQNLNNQGSSTKQAKESLQYNYHSNNNIQNNLNNDFNKLNVNKQNNNGKEYKDVQRQGSETDVQKLLDTSISIQNKSQPENHQDNKSFSVNNSIIKNGQIVDLDKQNNQYQDQNMLQQQKKQQNQSFSNINTSLSNNDRYSDKKSQHNSPYSQRNSHKIVQNFEEKNRQKLEKSKSSLLLSPSSFNNSYKKANFSQQKQDDQNEIQPNFNIFDKAQQLQQKYQVVEVIDTNVSVQSSTQVSFSQYYKQNINNASNMAENIDNYQINDQQEQLQQLTIKSNDGDIIYEGTIQNNLYEGLGKLKNILSEEQIQKKIQNNSKNFNDCQKLSYGQFQNENQEAFFDWVVYEGQFKNGLFEGKGCLGIEGGNRYTGQFKNGFLHGFGTIQFKNGNIVIGEWNYGQFINDL